MNCKGGEEASFIGAVGGVTGGTLQIRVAVVNEIVSRSSKDQIETVEHSPEISIASRSLDLTSRVQGSGVLGAVSRSKPRS